MVCIYVQQSAPSLPVDQAKNALGGQLQLHQMVTKLVDTSNAVTTLSHSQQWPWQQQMLQLLIASKSKAAEVTAVMSIKFAVTVIKTLIHLAWCI